MFKDKLVELRKNNKDTQESLAIRLNVSRSLVAKWEQGRAYPTNDDLDNIAKIYNVTYEELLSQKELKDIYGIAIKNNQKKNIIILVLSLCFSIVIVILLIINYVPKTRKIFLDKNEVNTNLTQHSIVNGEESESNFMGESEKNNFMLNKELYTWEWFQMYRYNFTDKSNLYYFHYMANFTSGYTANFNSNQGFNKDALINEINISINFNDYKNINPLYSWPKIIDQDEIVKSKFSSNIIIESVETMHGVTINKKGDNLILSYDSSDDLLDIIMQQGCQTQAIKFDYSNTARYISSEWNYKVLIDDEKKLTQHIHLYYLFEVNESEVSEFSFNVNKSVTTESNKKLTMTNHITTYNCYLESV